MYDIQINKKLNVDTYKVHYLNNKVKDFSNELFKIYTHCEKILLQLQDKDIEELNNGNKRYTSWSQFYDVELMIEHAISHVMRYRIQIENFLENGK